MKEQGVEMNLETQNPEIELPEDIEIFFSKNFKTNEEELGDVLITQFLDVLKNKEKLKMILINYLVTGMAVGYIDKKDGHPHLLQFLFDEAYFDINPEEEVQKDIDIFAHFKYYTKNEILNKFKLDKGQRKKLDDIFARLSAGKLLNVDYNFSAVSTGSTIYDNSKDGVSYKGWFDNSNKSNRIRVLSMEWKSRRELRTKTYTDKKSGKEITKLLSLKYKEKKNDVIERADVETRLFIETIGPELVLDYGEITERLSPEDYISKVKIPVTAIIDRNFIKNDELRSVAAKLLELQSFASDILYQLRLMIKQNNGRVMVYDTAQIPKIFLTNYGPEKALNRMMHHIKKDQLLFINSKDKNSRNTFNQFTSLDMSNRGATKDLIEGLMLVDDLAEKFVGLNKERKGGGEQYQTATGIQRNILASNARTEVYYEPFDNFVGDLLSKTLMKSKAIYKKGAIVNYIFGDMQTMFITISEKFPYTDLGMYIGDSSKNYRDKSTIDQSVTQALGNAQEPDLILGLIDVLEKDSATEAKGILERLVKRMDKLKEAEQENLRAIEDAKIKHENEKLDREDRNKELDRENKLEVAYVHADVNTFNAQTKQETDMIQTAAKLEADLIKGNSSGGASTKPPAKKTTSNKKEN